MEINRKSEAGFGLIEVLITILVFSIGALGIAGLQAVARGHTYEALQRTTASWLAHSIVASMRANKVALDVYAYSGFATRKSATAGNPQKQVPTQSTLGSGQTVADLRSNAARKKPSCFDNACTPRQMAYFDLRLWQQALDSSALVNPVACIFGPAGGADGVYTIVIAWRGVEERDAAGVHPCGQGRISSSGQGPYSAPGSSDGGAAYQRALVLTTYIAVSG